MATTKAARKPAAKKAPAEEVKGKNTTGRAGVLTRIRRGETLTKRLMRMRLIYSYGGGRVAGHITTPLAGQKWTDCSGFATYLLDAMGIKLRNDAGSTWSLAEEGEAGVGEFFTLFIKNAPGDEHVICRLRQRPRPWHFGKTKFRWVECGGTDNPHLAAVPRSSRPARAWGWPRRSGSRNSTSTADLPSWRFEHEQRNHGNLSDRRSRFRRSGRLGHSSRHRSGHGAHQRPSRRPRCVHLRPDLPDPMITVLIIVILVLLILALIRAVL
jgi:hypothetical protein